jgi:hypothetical protein
MGSKRTKEDDNENRNCCSPDSRRPWLFKPKIRQPMKGCWFKWNAPCGTAERRKTASLANFGTDGQHKNTKQVYTGNMCCRPTESSIGSLQDDKHPGYCRWRNGSVPDSQGQLVLRFPKLTARNENILSLDDSRTDLAGKSNRGEGRDSLVQASARKSSSRSFATRPGAKDKATQDWSSDLHVVTHLPSVDRRA